MREPTIQELQCELAKRDLLEFTLQTCEGYQAGWFHRAVADELERFLADVVARKRPRLILEAPPRHGKSELASRRFPAWALGKHPNLSIIATSYGADLASRMNRDVQRIIDVPKSKDGVIRYPEVFPNTSLSGENVRTTAQGTYLRNSDIFEIVGHKGSYRSTGVGGGITGMGADILLIDDPIKDAEQADSEVYRKNLWDWYTSTAYTRLMPGGGVIIILTRWHEDDLVGRLLDAAAKGEGDQWRVVRYAAIAEEDEYTGEGSDRVLVRRTGEALHPDRYGIKELQAIKTVLGTRKWNALYQQRPTASAGNRFQRDWWRFWRPDGVPGFRRPDGCKSPEESPAAVINLDTYRWDEITISVDANFKESAKADPVVVSTVGRKGPNRYLLDRFRDPCGFGKTKLAIKSARERYPRARRILVEVKANGDAIVEDLKAEITGVVGINPEGGKEARAAVMEPVVEAGNWWLPEHMPWLEELVSEFAEFPLGKHDDQVDSLSQLECDWTTESGIEFARRMGRMTAQG